MSKAMNIAVVGGSKADSKTLSIAYDVGKEIALQGWTVICGGLGGVMEAAAKGAYENNGKTIGILPGYDHGDANNFIQISIPTGLGHARNAVIASGANGMIAIDGTHGTLSEMALALKMNRPVVAINSQHSNISGVVTVATASEAIKNLKGRLV